jgi:hypothetical protein
MSPSAPSIPHDSPDDDPDPGPTEDDEEDPFADPPNLHRTDTFTLAGRSTYEPPPYCYRTDSYVQPQYQEYQEPYEHERTPVWGLAGPLPRTIRPGMRPRRVSDAQTLPDNVPTLRNVHNGMRHVQSNVSRQPSSARLPRRTSTRQPVTARPATTHPIDEEGPPTYGSAHDTTPGVQQAKDAEANAATEQSSSRVDLLRTAAANAYHQHENDHHEQLDPTSGQVQQEISNHASHDFATERPSLAPIQEIPRPSLIDKPEVEALRKRLQAQPDFVPHRSRSICRPPTEYDFDISHASHDQHTSHLQRPPSRGSLRRRRSRSTSTANTRQQHQHNRTKNYHEFLNTWSKYRYNLREPLAEFLAVFVMMFCGLSANLMNRINLATEAPTARYGDFR